MCYVLIETIKQLTFAFMIMHDMKDSFVFLKTQILEYFSGEKSLDKVLKIVVINLCLRMFNYYCYLLYHQT